MCNTTDCMAPIRARFAEIDELFARLDQSQLGPLVECEACQGLGTVPSAGAVVPCDICEGYGWLGGEHVGTSDSNQQ